MWNDGEYKCINAGRNVRELAKLENSLRWFWDPVEASGLLITRKMQYYFSSTFTFFDLDFIDFCNVMLVLCVYFTYLLIKGPCASNC